MFSINTNYLQPFFHFRRLGIGEALTLIKKKPKMSILDKSNHDWSNFKEENQLQVTFWIKQTFI